jgi:yecA family protein
MTKLAMKQLRNWILTFHDDSHDLAYWHGFITAVACGPEPIKPSQWLNPILHPNDMDESFSSTDEAQKRIGFLLEMYNEINDAVTGEQFEPYLGDDPEDLRKWCKGFILGINLWNKSKIDGNRDFFVLILPLLVIIEGETFFEKNTGFTDEMKAELLAASPELLKSYVPKLRKIFPPGH